MYKFYKALTSISAPFLGIFLKKRLKAGKEHPERYQEKKAQISLARPNGKLIWIHAASVGESQSALIVIDNIQSLYHEMNILVTTGTRTSAELMEKKLPKNAIHQFAPLDHPKWVKSFLNHWKPDAALWMESELWPNMLMALKEQGIKTVLLNAHMSEKSYKSWSKAKLLSQEVLSSFRKILCQTEKDKERFENLGAINVIVTDNLKYSADPLIFNKEDLENLKKATSDRKLWLYASTHKGEEELAFKVHRELQSDYPGLLTIIVPRHPERREEISFDNINYSFRGENKVMPTAENQIYIADTLGELGLFYKLAPIACIGRSFSEDGGGGHNPIEAAQMGCAVLHGPHVQNLQDIFDDMKTHDASVQIDHKNDFAQILKSLLSDQEKLKSLQEKAKEFSTKKTSVIKTVMVELRPILDAI